MTDEQTVFEIEYGPGASRMRYDEHKRLMGEAVLYYYNPFASVYHSLLCEWVRGGEHWNALCSAGPTGLTYMPYYGIVTDSEAVMQAVGAPKCKLCARAEARLRKAALAAGTIGDGE